MVSTSLIYSRTPAINRIYDIFQNTASSMTPLVPTATLLLNAANGPTRKRVPVVSTIDAMHDTPVSFKHALLTLDDGVVAASVQKYATRFVTAAVHLVTLVIHPKRKHIIQEGTRWSFSFEQTGKEGQQGSCIHIPFCRRHTLHYIYRKVRRLPCKGGGVTPIFHYCTGFQPGFEPRA